MTDTGTNTPIHQVVVISGGTSGRTAAIYAARASLNPIVFEGSVTASGALYTTANVENFPGFAQGIQSPELIEPCASRPNASAPRTSPTTSSPWT